MELLTSPILLKVIYLPDEQSMEFFLKNCKTRETNKITGTFLWPVIFYLRAGATRKMENYACHRI